MPKLNSIASPKFLNLQKLRHRQSFKHLVPPFYHVPLPKAGAADKGRLTNTSAHHSEKTLAGFKKLFNHHMTYILRSSLKGEGGGKPGRPAPKGSKSGTPKSNPLKSNPLKPGQSLSISNIQSFNSFIKAYNIIKQQKNVECIILQEQKFVDHHLTCVFFKNIVFLENTDQEKQFFYLNQHSHIGANEFISPKILRRIYSELQGASQYLNCETFIAELGVCDDRMFVFQLMPVTGHSLIEPLMMKYEEALHKEASKAKCRVVDELLWLWRAWRLRQTFKSKPQLFSSQHNCYEYVVSNWRALINCWRVYSWLHPKACFFDFYTWAMRAETWWARWGRQHFSIATQLSKGSFVSQDFINNYNKMIFLGDKNRVCDLQVAHGQVKPGQVAHGQDTPWQTAPVQATSSMPVPAASAVCKAYLLDDLDPRDIYALPQHSVILTSSSNLLSHGYLAAIERNLPLVGNIPAPLLRKLKKQRRVHVQFKEKKITALEACALQDNNPTTLAA